MNAEEIKRTVCEVFEIDESEIHSPAKRRVVSDARKVILFLLLDRGLCYSATDACAHVGLKRPAAHTAIARFSDLLAFDRPFRLKYEEVLRRIS